MWVTLSQIILRNRITILVILGLLTGLWAYFATDVKVNTVFTDVLPAHDPVRKDYDKLKETFGEEANVIVLGIPSSILYTKENYNSWYQLGKDVKQVAGVDSVFSEAHIYNLVRNNKQVKFDFKLIKDGKTTSQAETDSIRSIVRSLPFYDKLLYNEEEDMSLMMVFINANRFNSDDRGTTVEDLIEVTEGYQKQFPKIHYSGLPYIRVMVGTKVKTELRVFVLYAIGVTSLILLIFFRSLKIVAVCITVVVISVVWSLGTIGLLDYRVTLQMGLIPALIIVIGIPNCIFLLNKYHSEIRIHGNQAKGLSRVIQKIGNATFMTNMTTSLGFGTFIFTQSRELQEFGTIAAINIITIFIISLLIIPIAFSFIKPPEKKHTEHLEKKWIDYSISKMESISTKHRKAVYLTTICLLIFAGIGISKMVTTGNITGDLPQNDPIVENLNFFERSLGGVIPFEILIDTKKEKRANQISTLRKIEKIQELLNKTPNLSKSLSIVDAIKFIKQSYYNGDSSKYKLIKGNEYSNIKRYLKNTASGSGKSSSVITSSFVDSTGQIARISVSAKDVGSLIIDSLVGYLHPRINAILTPEKPIYDSVYQLVQTGSKQEKNHSLAFLYDKYPKIQNSIIDLISDNDETLLAAFYNQPDKVFDYTNHKNFNTWLKNAIDSHTTEASISGTSVVFARGANYMVSNLLTSLLIAVCIIAIIMSFLFHSWKMVVVSLIPNFIPLLLTAAVMGYTGIPIKPSTILIFSIAFGISVDDTIHFLAKYRQELKNRHWDIKGSVIMAIRETGVSMIYTSIVLFFGFSMFSLSEFGGTKALGILVSMTLLIAMLANLLVLPSLLLSLDKAVTNKAFKEPLLEIIDEEEDIDLDRIIVQQGTNLPEN